AARRGAPRGAAAGRGGIGRARARSHPGSGSGYPCRPHAGRAAERGLGRHADRGRESPRRRAPGPARPGRDGPPGGGPFRERRAARAALDQMGHGKLQAEAVTKELASADAKLKETAWWIAGRHPEWAAALSGFLRERLAVKEMTPEQRADLVQQLAKLARGAA